MRIFFMLAVFLAVNGSCRKTDPGYLKPLSLTGRWEYVEYYASIGGPGSWYPVNQANQWIEIKENGNISTNMSYFDGVTGYQLEDSVTVKFIIPSLTGGARAFRYYLDTMQARLIMSPVNPGCIEGCAIKFKPY